MRKFFLTFIFILSIISINKLAAQTGVAINNDGAAANASAMLDVKATDKGVLIPRMASTASVTAPVTGLLIYQTGGTPGFYYYNGTAWVLIQNSGNANVTLQGNTFNGASQLVQLNGSSQLPSISGVNVTALNAANLASGTIPLARLGVSGTTNSTTFLRGDNTWAVPAGGGGGATLDLVATITTAQTLSPGGPAVAPSIITFNNTATSPSIPGASFNGTTYTVGQSGNYLIAVSIATTNTFISSAWPVLYVNGTVAVYGTSGQSGNLPNAWSRGTLTTVINLTAGNTLTIQASNNSTSNTLNYTSDGTSRFTITKL